MTIEAKHYCVKDVLDCGAVLPVGGNKKPLCSRGVRDAKVRSAWNGNWPKNAKTGIACGPLHGTNRLNLAVIDIDGPLGQATYDALGLPATASFPTSTPGHRHYYFLVKEPIRGAKPHDEIDIKAEGGYVIWYDGDPTQEIAILDSWPAELLPKSAPASGTSRARVQPPAVLDSRPVGSRSEEDFATLLTLLANLPRKEAIQVMQVLSARYGSKGADWQVDEIARAEAWVAERIGDRYAIVLVGGRLRIADRLMPGDLFTPDDWARSLPLAYRGIARAWFDGLQTPRYRGLTFSPRTIDSDPATGWNLWRGFKVEPGDGDCSMLLDHIREHLCAGDAALSDWLLDFFAHLVQRPWERPTVGVILKSVAHGTGKNVFTDEILHLLCDENGVDVQNASMLTGKFNRLLDGCLVFVGNEASFAGDGKQQDLIKGLLTAPTIVIERKNIDQVEIPFFARIILTSNRPVPVRITGHDRRWTVIDVPEHPHTRDQAWFGALKAQQRGGGDRAFMRKLLERDISHFNPFEPHHTIAKEAVIDAGRDPLELELERVTQGKEGFQLAELFSWLPYEVTPQLKRAVTEYLQERFVYKPMRGGDDSKPRKGYWPYPGNR